MNPQMILQMLPALKSNPTQFMQQYGVNVPEGQFQGPQQMAMNLASNGFCDQATLNMAQQTAQQMGYEL